MGALGAVLSTFITLSANPALIGVLPATSGGTDWQAAYDNDRDISWVANANLADTMDFGVTDINGNGTMTWDKANEWIAAMNTANYLDFNNWRLPTTLQPDASCDQQDSGAGVGFGVGGTGSEMGHHCSVASLSNLPVLKEAIFLLSTSERQSPVKSHRQRRWFT